MILSVRPGITDLATLQNPDEGATLAKGGDPERIYLEEIRPEKLRLQLQYVRTRSLLLDVKILVATAATVCRLPVPFGLGAPTLRAQP